MTAQTGEMMAEQIVWARVQDILHEQGIHLDGAALRALQGALLPVADMLVYCQTQREFLATLFSRVAHLHGVEALSTALARAAGRPLLVPWHVLPDVDEEHRQATLHDDLVLGCAVAADGTVVSSSADGTLRVWDGEQAVCRYILRGHGDYVSACRTAHGGEFAISSSLDNTVRVWHLPSGEEQFVLEGQSAGFFAGLTCLALDAADRLILAGSIDGTVQAWETATGEMAGYFQAHEERVTACAVEPDGRWVVTASDDGSLRIRELATGDELTRLRGHRLPVHCVGVAPDGDWLVSGGEDLTLNIWQTGSGRLLETLQGHTRPVNDCAVHPSGEVIASTGEDNTVKIWEVGRGEQLASLRVNSPLYACAWHPDGRHLVVGGERGVYFLQVIW
jgi:WD40 repeat protein